MAWWLSWLERRPVTAEVVGSNPIRVAAIIMMAIINNTPSRCGGTGRRTGLKILRDLYSHTGSIPVAGIVINLTLEVRVAQLDRASGYGPEGREFESCHVHLLTLHSCKVFLFSRNNN